MDNKEAKEIEAAQEQLWNKVIDCKVALDRWAMQNLSPKQKQEIKPLLHDHAIALVAYTAHVCAQEVVQNLNDPQDAEPIKAIGDLIN